MSVKTVAASALNTLNATLTKRVSGLRNKLQSQISTDTPLYETPTGDQPKPDSHRNSATRELFPFGDGSAIKEKPENKLLIVESSDLTSTPHSDSNITSCRSDSYILLDYDAVADNTNNGPAQPSIPSQPPAKSSDGYFDGYMKSYVAPVIKTVGKVRDILPFIQATEKPKASQTIVKKNKALIPVISKDNLCVTTKSLVLSVIKAESNSSLLSRLGELSLQLRLHPETCAIAAEYGVVNHVQALLASNKSTPISQQCHQLLALFGVAPSTGRRGIRILTIDGGGTRGLISVEVLREIERCCGQPIYTLFDYICGVSTGALIASIVGIFRVSPQQAESIYKQFSREMFERNSLLGTGQLVLSHAYYDASIWERILRNHIGEKLMVDTAKNPGSPKIGVVSCLMSGPVLKPYVFRSYNLPPHRPSIHAGSSAYKIWQAIRASSAAPGYFPEYALDGNTHLDGGIHTNNPAAVALHESRCLWPDTPIQCLVSLGNGRHEPTINKERSEASLKLKLTRLIQSATDTEAVHNCLQDLLPPGSYFRFNPYISEDFQLDEIRPAKLEKLEADTRSYLLTNHQKLDALTKQLLKTSVSEGRLLTKLYDRIKQPGLASNIKLSVPSLTQIA